MQLDLLVSGRRQHLDLVAWGRVPIGKARNGAVRSVRRLGPPAGCMISDSGWRTQVATAARLMVADGCGLRQRTKHVEDDKGEL
jgi:hypothetical protein